MAQRQVVAELVHEYGHADVAACFTPEVRADGDHEVAASKVSDAGGGAVVVVVAPDDVVEGAFAGGVELALGGLDPVKCLEFAVECLVADFITAAEVVLGAAGATGVQVNVDAGGAVGVANGQLREGFGDAVELILTGEQAGHVVHLNEDVLLQRIGTHAGEVDVNLSVAVGIIALHLPGVGDAVTVNVGVVGVSRGCRNRAEHQQSR